MFLRRIILAVFIMFPASLWAQKKEPIRILFILDASNSMYQRWGSVIKIDEAKRLMSEEIDKLNGTPNLEVALRVYGTISPVTDGNCKDTKLILPFEAPDFENFKRMVNSIRPNGITPIAYSLQQCAGDFPNTPGRNVIILVTDGIESCHGDPCKISLDLQKKGICLKPFIIGMNVREENTQDMQCIGNYYNAPDAAAFRKVMKNILQTAISNTYVQINLDDINNKPTESDAVLAFTDETTDMTKYNYYHTITYRGESDTVSVNPITTYDLTVYTTPLIERKALSLVSDQNNIINIPAPQGYLEVLFEGQAINPVVLQKISTIVNKDENNPPVCYVPYGNKQKLICGNYNIEIMTIPRTLISNVNIAESKTTTIKLPMPGLASFQKNTTGFGAIFIYEKNGLNKVYDLQMDALGENVALQPGNYKVVFRSVKSDKSMSSESKDFKITSGQTTYISL